MEVRVLGRVELLAASGDDIALPGNKMAGLVAVLGLEAGGAVSPQRLIEALWGENDVSGANTLHALVSKLRRVLADRGETDRLITGPAGYELRVEREAVDALRFEALVDQARALDDPTSVAEKLGIALQLWRGEPLSGLPDTAPIGAIRARLEELRRVAVEDLVDAELALGRHRQLVLNAESLVAEEPLRERRWGQLIRALYGSGRQADALRAFQRARAVLIEEVGVEPGPELRQLEEAVLAQDDAALGAPSAAPSEAPIGEGLRRKGNFRHPVGVLIGRDADVAALVDLVGRHRLMTLVGPGGVGKTRLALDLSVAVIDSVPDGVWWIELAPARSPADVMASVQRALGMDSVAAGDTTAALAAVVAVLEDREALLVLDNCEHLVASIAPAIEELLGRCGRLRVVATSREGFGIPGEHLFGVETLDPASAVALFAARAASPVVNDASEDAILAICERLDRLPLALELAAARTRHLRLDEILERLTNRFEVLRDGSRTAQEHQRNLEAVAQWSYELLDPSDRIVFERLAVFADGATLDAARATCGARGVAFDDVEPALDRLIDKSLVIADRSGAQTRYRMLQTLADYAGERLDASGDRDAAQRAHAMWVLAVAGTVRFGAKTAGSTVAAVEDEGVAIRDAIGWCLDADAQLGLQITSELAPFWFGTMRVSEGRHLLSAALDAAGTDDLQLRSSALAWDIVFATMVQDIEAAERVAEQALTFERTLGDPTRLGFICFAIALAAGYRSDGNAARWIAEARQHFALRGPPVGLGHVSFAEGAKLLVDGDLGAAAESLLDAISIFRSEEDHLGLILAVSRLGELAWRRGDIALFAEMHAELLELGRAGRSRGVTTGATARLGLARLLQGDVGDAQLLARAALGSTGESFMPVVNGYAFKTAGLVNLRLGHIDEGRVQLRDAIEAFEQGAGTVGVGQAAMCWVDLSQSYGETGEADEARQAAESAAELAHAAGDPWIQAQAEANLALINSLAELDEAVVDDAAIRPALRFGQNASTEPR